MGRIIWSVITIGLILFANWGIAKLFNNDFLDWSFLTGLAAVVLVKFFNSSGGMASEFANARLQSGNEDNDLQVEVWTRIEKIERRFKATPSFYVAIGYTLVSGIITFIYYFI
ncbi:hypothetical protein ACN6MT_16185 [Neobacillus niacini]|uniref:hypothetical protein n=1 Tax=Neobacillus niacini TaxID=86668 RepID=UPI003B01A589